MKCPNCGSELPDGTLFCTECGASVEANGNSPESQPSEPAAAATTPIPQPAEQPAAPTQPMPQPAEQPAAPTQPIPQPAEQPVAPTQPMPTQPMANQAVPPVPPVPPQQGYNQAGAQPNGQPTPYAAYANPQATEGLSTGMKVLWAIVGGFFGLIGVLIAYLVNKGNGDKAKSDGLKFSLIGMAIGIAMAIILTFAGIACTASIINTAAKDGTVTTTTTTTKPSTNSGSSSATSGSSSASSSSASSSSAGSTAVANPAYFDSYNGVTVSAAINLSGKEIVSQIEALDFEYSSVYEGWLSEDFHRTFDAENANSKWLTRDQVLAIPAGATNGDVMLMISDDTHYKSLAEAANALVNVNRVGTITIDDETQFELVTNDSGKRFLLMETFYPSGEIDINIIPESFITSGSFNTYMDENYPKDLDQIWNALSSSGTSA